MELVVDGRVVVDEFEFEFIYIRAEPYDDPKLGRGVHVVTPTGNHLTVNEYHNASEEVLEALDLMEPKPLPTEPGTVISGVVTYDGSEYDFGVLDVEGDWWLVSTGTIYASYSVVKPDDIKSFGRVVV